MKASDQIVTDFKIRFAEQASQLQYLKDNKDNYKKHILVQCPGF